VTSLGMSDA